MPKAKALQLGDQEEDNCGTYCPVQSHAIRGNYYRGLVATKLSAPPLLSLPLFGNSTIRCLERSLNKTRPTEIAL